MKIEPTLNKDGTVSYLATGTCNNYKFIAEGKTKSEAFQSALILIRENGIESRGISHLKAVT